MYKESQTPAMWLLLASAPIIGILTHRFIFIHGEWDAWVNYIIASTLVLHLAIVSALSYISHGNFLTASYTVFPFEVGYMFGFTGSLILYRLLLHPLRRFPGPSGAKLWIWRAAWSTFVGGERGAVDTHSLHELYGDIVRIGPNHLTIRSASAVSLINGTGKVAGCHKSIAYLFPTYPNSVNAERDPLKHAAHRKVSDKALEPGSVHAYIPSLVERTHELISRLKARQGRLVHVNKEMDLYMFDVLGSIGFGLPGGFGTMASGKQLKAIYDINLTWRIGVYMMMIPWLHVLLDIFPTFFGLIYLSDIQLRGFIEGAIGEKMCLDATCPKAVGAKPSIIECFSSSTISGVLLTRSQLISNSFIMTIALTDTTISALIHMTYLLARHASAKENLYREITSSIAHHGGAQDWPIISKLPYLDAFINEVLRLHPPNPTPLSRVTPTEGLWLDNETYIPGGVNVPISEWSLHRDPRCFALPEDFIPERWISHSAAVAATGIQPKPEMILDKRAFMPFLKGPYRCAGIYMAYMELKMWLVNVLLAFDICFEEDADVQEIDRRMAEEWRDWGMMHAAKLEVRFVERE